MLLSNEQIEKFRSLYKEQFGEELSEEEAYDAAAKLLRLVQLIYRPITTNQLQELMKKDS